MQDIHDIKGLVLSAGYAQWVWWLLGAVLVTILTVFVIYYLKRGSGPESGKRTPVVAPDAKALGRLNKLDVASISGKKFYFKLSAILREYVFDRFGIGASEMTTEEFVPHIKELPLEMEDRRKLTDLCLASDTIKFAKGIAIETKMRDDLDYMRRIVRRTAMKDHEDSRG